MIKSHSFCPEFHQYEMLWNSEFHQYEMWWNSIQKKVSQTWTCVNDNIKMSNVIYLQVTKENRDFHGELKWKHDESSVHVFHSSMNRFKHE